MLRSAAALASAALARFSSAAFRLVVRLRMESSASALAATAAARSLWAVVSSPVRLSTSLCRVWAWAVSSAMDSSAAALA